MRIAAATLCLTASLFAAPIAAGPVAWICKINLGNNAVIGPVKYEVDNGYLVTPPADTNGKRFKYKITQESDDGLIAEISNPPNAGVSRIVTLLDKRTGHIRDISVHANGSVEPLDDGTCVQE